MTPRRTRTRTRTRIRPAAASALAAALASALLAGCGAGADSAPPATGASAASTVRRSHNAQDVTFAREMIPHHRQALAMAALASSRAKSPQVKSLAARIEKAQKPEIDTMSGWLGGWGERVPDDSATGMEGMPGMDHSASPMPGMMSDAAMGELRNLTGDAFDGAFLKMMIGHHEGAVAMAKTERAKGAYGPARTMAASVITAQSAEITEMNALLRT
ncbi:DUF305 domain-containing protein [Streptomyces sp. NPDC048664]|uniref:DUF305 domain-containing protein n=1 Tax=Streptomyces sp. NPDC048664 TaxID=3154505 RepID=UPI00343A1E33